MKTEIKQLELLFDRPAATEPKLERFFCVTHQAELPLSQQSEDPRYCLECFGVIKGSETQSYPAIRWSKCGLVEFLDGRCYTVDRKGQTVDIGREVDVLETFKTGEIAKDLCPDRVVVLRDILELRKEIIDGTGTEKQLRPVRSDRQHARSERNRPGRRVKSQVRNHKLSAPGKRVSRR
jgi:hypothetical protein